MSRALRVLVTVLVTVLVCLVLGLPGPASAHDGGTGEDGEGSAAEQAEHAAQDLVGTPMSEIEADTAAQRRALRSAGELPSIPARTAATAARAAGVAGTQGAWSAVVPTDVVPVFTAVLPNGKVLMWDSVGDQGVDAYPVQTFTRAMVFDPATNTGHRVDVPGYNIFCAGFVQLSNGNVLVVGGNKDPQQDGIRQTHLFSWQSETWSRGPDMSAERWYPSVAALANGEALIVAGGSDTAEVYQPDGQLRPLVGFDSFAYREYPFLVPRLDGTVEVVGPDLYVDRYDTAGSGSKIRTGIRDQTYRNYGSFATYDYGRTLVTGGGPVDPDGSVHPTATSVVVDTTSTGPTTAFAPTGSMSVPRRMQNLTLLADGSALVTGGMNSPDKVLVDLANAVRVAERWDPRTGAWTQLASASRVREYHSSAVLLPDGRVMTGGGGICGDCVAAGYLEKNVEYFSPPYLFDSAGNPAVRPSITGAPADVAFGSSFTFSSSSAADIAKVGLVRLGADTHGVDQGQRYLPLSYSRTDTTIRVDAPGNGGVAPPGYYLLFAVTSGGVPSVAATVHVGPTYASPSTPVVTGKPRCLEVRGGGRNQRHQVVRWTCTRGPNQAWKRKHGTLRTAGGCLTLGAGGGAFRVGDKVTLQRCTGGRRQSTAVPGRSIRPAEAPGLCVSSKRRRLVLGDSLRLSRCSSSPAQRWTWKKLPG